VRSIQKRGGQVYEGARVVEISRSQPAKIRLAHGGEIIAEHVVLATGGYTPEVGFLRGRIFPVHLQVLLTEPLQAAALKVLGWTGREGVIDSRRIFNYFRLTEDNRILFGGGTPTYRWGGSADEAPGGVPQVQRLTAELAATFPPEANLRIDRSWSGVIDYVLDTLPVIGRLREHPAVVYVGGWCGHGIALSVSSGAWVTHLIDHQRPPENLPWFREKAPLLPLEPVRWLGVPISGWAMSVMDQL
jgi:gamma-glutamylputrescine oxidase